MKQIILSLIVIFITIESVYAQLTIGSLRNAPVKSEINITLNKSSVIGIIDKSIILNSTLQTTGDVTLEDTEVELSNAEIICDELIIGAGVDRLFINGLVKIKCRLVTFAAGAANTFVIMKSGTKGDLSLKYTNAAGMVLNGRGFTIADVADLKVEIGR